MGTRVPANTGTPLIFAGLTSIKSLMFMSLAERLIYTQYNRLLSLARTCPNSLFRRFGFCRRSDGEGVDEAVDVVVWFDVEDAADIHLALALDYSGEYASLGGYHAR